MYKNLKELALKYNLKLFESGLVLYTFGNLSVFDPDKGVLAIKPSGVPYNKLKVNDIVIVDLENKIVEGKLRPSSDTKTHIVLYKNFLGIRSIVHTHSSYATAWAQAKKSIPVLGTTHADHLNTDVPCTFELSKKMVKKDYEEQTGILIVDTLKKMNLSYKEVEMILVASHGPFTWGETPEKALYNSVMLEEIAKMAFFTLMINPDVKRIKKYLIEKHYKRKHGKDAYYGQKNISL